MDSPAAAMTFVAALASRYSSAIGLTILLYDIVITLGEEIRLIWTANLSLAKVLYLYNRYTVPIALIINAYMISGNIPAVSNAFCARWTLGLGIYQLGCSVGVIPTMLLLRVYALYNRNWRVLAALGALALSGVVTCFTLVVYGMEVNANQIVFVPTTSECSFDGMTTYMWAVWLMLNLYSLCFESIIITLILCRTWRNARAKVPMPMSKALLRDGLAYFGTMFIILILCLIVYTAFPTQFSLTLIYFAWSMHATLVSRIYLHLRGVTTPVDWTTNTVLRQPPPPTTALPPVPALPSRGHRLGRSNGPSNVPSRAPSRGPSRRGHLRLLSDATEIEDFVVEITHRPIDYYETWDDAVDAWSHEEKIWSTDEPIPPVEEESWLDEREIGIAL